MNTLEISKEVRRINFTYTTDNYKYTGTCDINSDNTVTNIDAQVMTITGESIGNCNSNGRASVNIWNSNYKNSIDTVSSEFKSLQTDIFNKYNTLVNE